MRKLSYTLATLDVIDFGMLPVNAVEKKLITIQSTVNFP